MTCGPRVKRRPLVGRLGMLWGLLLAFSAPLCAQPQFYLVTYGPGELVWERFGHNALWLVDEANQYEALYNFGYFDFAQHGFWQNFIFGRMRYFAAAADPATEFPAYRYYQRSIEYQRLNLEPAQAQQLAQLLQISVLPQNREYLYDYFLANCSTQVRDAIDQVLGGALQRATHDQPAQTSFRHSALTMVQEDFWVYLGMQLGLGRTSERPVSLWEAFYLPYVLRDHIDQINYQQQPLASPPRLLATGMAVPTQLHVPYLTFAGLGGLMVMLLLGPWLLWHPQCSFWAALPCRMWWTVSGLAGSVLAFLWLATDHQAAWHNENLLLLNPLALCSAVLPLRYQRLQRALLWLLLSASLVAVVMKLLPHSQFNHDVLLWLVPAQWTALWVMFRQLSRRCAIA